MRLYPYQYEIVHWILDHPRCAIWAPMGSGKTLATLYALSGAQLLEPGPALVIAPLRVARSTWPNECAKWPGLELTCSPILGSEHERLKALRAPANIYTVNYDNLSWLVDTLGDDWPFNVVIADESTKLKGFRTRQGGKRTRALGTVAHSKVHRFIELTGTPAPQGLKDLWGQAWFLDKGARLGLTHTAFIDRWFYRGTWSHDIRPMPRAQSQIQSKLSDICVTIDCGDDIDAPIVRDVRVELPPQAREVYRDLERDMFAALEDSGGDITAVNAAALSSKCQQVANGAVYDEQRKVHFVHDAKIDAVESIIEEANGAPIIVAYTFKHDLDRLKKRFPKGRELDNHPQTIAFWNGGKIPLLFAHPASAGHGLNLQDGGNIIVLFGLNWSLELYLQIIERIGPRRQKASGHNRPVYVYRIVAERTVDELILERWAGNGSVQDILLKAMRADAKVALAH